MGAFYFCKQEHSLLPQPQTNLQYGDGASLGPGGADTLTKDSYQRKVINGYIQLPVENNQLPVETISYQWKNIKGYIPHPHSFLHCTPCLICHTTTTPSLISWMGRTGGVQHRQPSLHCVKCKCCVSAHS